MKKQTKSEKIIAALEVFGCKRVEGRTNKYVQLARPNKPGHFYFVGRNGSLREGRTVSSSFSLTDMVDFESIFAQAEKKRQEQAS